jgi:hypothetical protein
MKYLLLLYDEADAVGKLSADERRALVEQHIEFSRRLREAGAMVMGEALAGPESATTLRFDGRTEPSVSDGPFLETKEALGGFYVLECESLDAAVRIAGDVPRSPGLVAELRPIVDV